MACVPRWRHPDRAVGYFFGPAGSWAVAIFSSRGDLPRVATLSLFAPLDASMADAHARRFAGQTGLPMVGHVDLFGDMRTWPLPVAIGAGLAGAA